MSSLGFVQHVARLTLLDLSRTTVGDFTPVECCPSLRKLIIGGRQPMRLPSMCKLPGLQVGQVSYNGPQKHVPTFHRALPEAT